MLVVLWFYVRRGFKVGQEKSTRFDIMIRWGLLMQTKVFMTFLRQCNSFDNIVVVKV